MKTTKELKTAWRNENNDVVLKAGVMVQDVFVAVVQDENGTYIGAILDTHSNEIKSVVEITDQEFAIFEDKTTDHQYGSFGRWQTMSKLISGLLFKRESEKRVEITY